MVLKKTNPPLTWDYQAKANHIIDMVNHFELLLRDVETPKETTGKKSEKEEAEFKSSPINISNIAFDVKTSTRKALAENNKNSLDELSVFIIAATSAFFKISILEKCDFTWPTGIMNLYRDNTFLKQGGLTKDEAHQLRNDVFNKIYNSFFTAKSKQIVSSKDITKTILTSPKMPSRWIKDKSETGEQKPLRSSDKKWWLKMILEEKPYNQMVIDYFVKVLAITKYLKAESAEKTNVLNLNVMVTYLKEQLILLQQLSIYLEQSNLADCVKKLLQYKVNEIGEMATKSSATTVKQIIEASKKDKDAQAKALKEKAKQPTSQQKGKPRPTERESSYTWNPFGKD